MTAEEWLEGRTLKELLQTRALLEPFAGADARVKYRLTQVDRELRVRCDRQVAFMDRLDGVD